MSELDAESLSGSPLLSGQGGLQMVAVVLPRWRKYQVYQENHLYQESKVYQGIESVPKCESTPPWWRWFGCTMLASASPALLLRRLCPVSSESSRQGVAIKGHKSLSLPSSRCVSPFTSVSFVVRGIYYVWGQWQQIWKANTTWQWWVDANVTICTFWDSVKR